MKSTLKKKDPPFPKLFLFCIWTSGRENRVSRKHFLKCSKKRRGIDSLFPVFQKVFFCQIGPSTDHCIFFTLHVSLHILSAILRVSYCFFRAVYSRRCVNRPAKGILESSHPPDGRFSYGKTSISLVDSSIFYYSRSDKNDHDKTYTEVSCKAIGID